MAGNILNNSSAAFLLLVSLISFQWLMMTTTIQVESAPLKHTPPPPPAHGYGHALGSPPPPSNQKPHHHRHPRHGGPANGGTGTAAFTLPPYTPSTCLKNAAPNTTMIAAVESSLFRHGKACGQEYEVRCVGAAKRNQPNPCKKGAKPVVVTVIDVTSPEKKGHKSSDDVTFVLSIEATKAIAKPHAGYLAISFKPINKGTKPYY